MPTDALLYWLVWIFIFFLPAELYAAKNKRKGDTLSEFVRYVFNTTLEKVILSAFFLFLVLHFVFQLTVIPVVVFGAMVSIIIGRTIIKG